MRQPRYKKIEISQRVMISSADQLFDCLLSCNHRKFMIINIVSKKDKLPKTTICEICTAYEDGYSDGARR